MDTVRVYLVIGLHYCLRCHREVIRLPTSNRDFRLGSEDDGRTLQLAKVL